MLTGLVDAHVHSDGLSEADAGNLAALGVRHVVACAHDGVVEPGETSAEAWLRQYERMSTVDADRLKIAGLRPYFAFGIPPSKAPWRGLDRLFDRLPAFLSHPAAVAIGVLALHRFDDRERAVLDRQLALAVDLRRPVIVSLPAMASDALVRAILAHLQASGVESSRILVENVPVEAIPILLGLDFAIALEPSDGRLDTAQILATIRREGAARFVLTSHAGEGSAELLTLPSLAAQLLDAGLSRDVVLRVARDNALRFLGRIDAARLDAMPRAR